MNNIPKINLERVLIVGGGFAGLKLALELDHDKYQVVLIDKNNYHQFQPLFYQVATAGLEPSAISFPFRKIFHKVKNFHFRMAKALKIVANENKVNTDIGDIAYDHLVLAMGADTNYFGNKEIEATTMPMKTTSEALYIRNTIIQNYENAVNCKDDNEQDVLLDIVVVGGGPTGVEVSGALAEMKTHILPKDYPEIDFTKMQIYLIDGSDRLLSGMSPDSSQKAKEYLEKLGVIIKQNDYVADFKDKKVVLKSGASISSNNVIWAAGIIPNIIEGLDAEKYNKGKRLIVDKQNKVTGYKNIYALGDNASMEDDANPRGHTQVAGVAQQQAMNLAYNLNNGTSRPFKYNDKGSMATIGRNLAVVELPFLKLQGIIAWFIWMFVHLMLILGVKNRLLIFINWAWSYLTFDQSLRLLIKPVNRKIDK
jgi:NADH dehydrogenase